MSRWGLDGVTGWWLGVRRLASAKKAEEQLPEAILALTAGLRAGLSFSQALAVTAGDTPPPLGRELRRCLEEVDLGLNWPEALENLRRRAPGEGMTLLVWALAVHRRTGGDLPALCERLHELLSERRRLRAKLAATTAQGRLSAGVVALVPPVLGFALHRLAPDFLSPLLTTPAGWALLAWAGVMNGFGAMMIKRLSDLKW